MTPAPTDVTPGLDSALIRFDGVTITYPGRSVPVLRDVRLAIGEGELCLVAGWTGSGKSTLLRAINGLVPWFSGGTLDGRVTVDGRSTADHKPRDLADLVGFVDQVPADGFVAEVVEDELAYTMENLGVPPDTMRRRVEEVVDLLGLHGVRGRSLASLSAGQQQRVAIGAVLTATPRVLVLDEPTSSLDPGAAEEVLAALTRLVHDVGLTVVVAEHRLERVLEYADRVVLVDGGTVTDGAPADLLPDLPLAPPVVELGRVAGWSPLPRSVREARRLAAPLRERLAATRPPGADRPSPPVTPAASVRGLTVAYGEHVALDGVDLDLAAGEVVAVMGRNGAGKSTLLAHLGGLRAPARGQVTVGGDEPHRLAPRDLIERVALVPDDPDLLLSETTVAAECEQADRDAGLDPGTTAAAVGRVVDGLPAGAHPGDLSEGQRLALALGIVLAPEPGTVLLDEPTRGLDERAKHRFVTVLRDLAAGGRAVVLATHDVELVAAAADRVVLLADGEIVLDGAARDVLATSPLFAPQVAKVLRDGGWLTVAEVAEALAR